MRYSYAKLGLLPKLNPRQAGGIEPVEALPYAIRSATAATMADLEADSEDDQEEDDDEEEEDDEDTPMASTSTAEPTPAAAGSATLAKGLGRIIRDENGKVIRIVMGGDDGQEIEEEVKERVERDSDEDDDDDESDEEEEEPKPWGEAMKDWSNEGVQFEEEEDLGPRSTGQGIPIFGGIRRSVEAKTDVVRGESAALQSNPALSVADPYTFKQSWSTSPPASARSSATPPSSRATGSFRSWPSMARISTRWLATARPTFGRRPLARSSACMSLPQLFAVERNLTWLGALRIIKAGGFAKLKAKAAQMEASA